MSNSSKVYLGDSVYVELENGMLKLTTNNGYTNDHRNVIYLGVHELHALEMYLDSYFLRLLQKFACISHRVVV